MVFWVRIAVFSDFSELVTDGWTYVRTAGNTDGRTDGRTDTPSYRNATAHLKTFIVVISIAIVV